MAHHPHTASFTSEGDCITSLISSCPSLFCGLHIMVGPVASVPGAMGGDVKFQQVFTVLVAVFLSGYEEVEFRSGITAQSSRQHEDREQEVQWVSSMGGTHRWPASPAESLSTPEGCLPGPWIEFICD